MFLGLDHVGVAVKDIEAAAAKLEKAFGLKVAAREEIKDQQVIAAMVPTSVGRFELMQPTNPESAVGRFIARRGEGIQHVCYAVQDVREASAALKARGAELVYGAPRHGFSGEVEFVHPKSASGVLVEIAQIMLFTPSTHDLRFHGVTLAYKDKDAAAAVWQKHFEMAMKRTRPASGFGIATTWLDAGNTEVEFAQPAREDVPMAHAVQKRGEGIYAVRLEASDPEAVAERARAAGVRVVADTSEPGNTVRVVHPSDLFGTMVLLLQKQSGTQRTGNAQAAGGHAGH